MIKCAITIHMEDCGTQKSPHGLPFFRAGGRKMGMSCALGNGMLVF
jgi:hypothetical protein